MAKYLILIYGDEGQWDEMSSDDERALGEGHRAFVAAAGSAVLDGGQLEASSAATTLRGDASGHPTPTDGPFLETKEVLGGYYLLEVSDLDRALALAGLLPEIRSRHCAVEVRPLVG
jgi:hypothetical protein